VYVKRLWGAGLSSNAEDSARRNKRGVKGAEGGAAGEFGGSRPEPAEGRGPYSNAARTIDAARVVRACTAWKTGFAPGMVRGGGWRGSSGGGRQRH
jgi:hypothetical protein